MRIVRLALFATAFTAVAASAAVTNRTDAGFVYRGLNGPFATEGSACPGVTVPSLPFTSTGGDTCGNTNVVTNYGGVCNTDLPFPYPGPEAVFQMTLAAGNNVAFSATLGAAGDLAIFVVGSACGTGTNCLGHSQDAIGPGVGPETIAAASYPAGTYFVYMDSYYATGNPGACGTFTLNITGSLPVELLQFEVN
jgi:hypothetical protein